MCCAASCIYNGVSYADGDEFLPYADEECFVCTCSDGEMECMMKTCPPVECDDAYAEPGECCPKCPTGAGECARAPS